MQLTKFIGAESATAAIVNAHSSGTPAGVSMNATQTAKAVLTGALTANTLATIVSITGVGVAPIIALQAEDATSRTLRLQVIADGVTAFDNTSGTLTGARAALIAAGDIVQTSAGNYTLIAGKPVRFFSSLLIKAASSLTETDKSSVLYTAFTE